MVWQQLIGHQQQLQWFQTAAARNRLGSTFLFVGQDGIGKRTFARLLAQSLLCRSSPVDVLSACGACEDCAQVRASTHPDLIEISKPKEKSEMPLELLIGRAEKRMREGLCYDISLRSYGGRRKVAIVDDADALNDEGANALLKTLEEPPEHSLLILVGTSVQRQLPTIRSRCQTILFRDLSKQEMIELILRNQLASTREQAGPLALASEGSIAQAFQLSDLDLVEFRKKLLDELLARPIDLIEVSKLCSAQADSAGKEGRLRRERLNRILRFAAELYRSIVLLLADEDGFREQPQRSSNLHLDVAVNQAVQQWSTGLNGALACWQSCLTAIDHVDRNANQTSLLHAWIAKVAQHSGC